MTIDKKSNLPRILFNILTKNNPEVLTEIKTEISNIASSVNGKKYYIKFE
jgi:hypothetical protein